MDFDAPKPIPRKHSLGSLRKVKKTTEKSPDLTGRLVMQRHDFERFAQEFSETNGDEITCDLAAWSNVDARGPFLTVQISPRYVPKQKQAEYRSDVDYFLDGWGDV